MLRLALCAAAAARPVAGQATTCSGEEACTAACRDLSIAVEVACLTSDNVRSSSPALLPAGTTSCPAACGTAWSALIAACPPHTDGWLLGGADGAAATDWISMVGVPAGGDGAGDAHSVVARIMLKHLELGLSKDLCTFTAPVCTASGCSSDGSTESVGELCSTAQRLAQYSATLSPSTQTAPTTGLGCETACSTACQALEDAAWAVGSGACCPSGATAADCAGVSLDLGAEAGVLTLEYAGMVNIYSASSACEPYVCSTEALAASFCGQTQGPLGGVMCVLTLATLQGALAAMGGDIPEAIEDCLTTLASDPATRDTAISEMCATSSTPCPGGAEAEQDDPDLLRASAATTTTAPAALLLSALLLLAF